MHGDDLNDVAKTNQPNPPEGWDKIGSSGALHRRFEFENYGDTSKFLERLASVSERTGLHPDLSFATKHVNVTVHAPAEGEDPTEQLGFAEAANQIFEGDVE